LGVITTDSREYTIGVQHQLLARDTVVSFSIIIVAVPVFSKTLR
jgi:hypothetical protein